MNRKVILTQDGSSTLEIEGWDEHYHSTHGAITEAYHVFIHNGLALFEGKEIHLLEIGLGTGLNAFITFLEHERLGQTLFYEGVEAYPLLEEEVQKLNYVERLQVPDKMDIFYKIHQSPWGTFQKLSDTFSLKKRQQFFQDINDKEQFDLIYFDAFGARVQP